MLQCITEPNRCEVSLLMFDVLLLLFFAIGMVLGYFRGAYAGVILLVASYVPMFIFVYFYDFITEFVSGIITNSGDGITAAIGGLGAFSGVIAIAGLFGALFFGTRLILKIMKVEQLSVAEKIAGALVGVIGQNIAATLAFFLIYTAIPVHTASSVKDSLWIKMMRPIHVMTYPTYVRALRSRTQNLSVSIAQNGLAETFLGGVSLASFNDGLGFDKPSIADAVKAVNKLSENINIQEITDLLDSAKDQDVTPEEIDRRIKEEQANRLREIQRQLK